MGDAVEVKTSIRLKPFPVPDHAVVDMPPRPRQDEMHALPTLALNELAPEALEALAERWLDNLFASVGRPSPFYRRGEAVPR